MPNAVSPALTRRLTAGLLTLLCLGSPGLAVTFDFPGSARIAASRTEPLSSVVLPLGRWVEGTFPSRRIEGTVEQTAWSVDAPGLSTLELLAPLRAQLLAQGFSLLWECDTANCGGFDFRFAIDVLPEPDMHVDLGDFRFLAAERPGAPGTETVTLLVSRSISQGFVQLVRVSPQDATAPAPAVIAEPLAAPEPLVGPVPVVPAALGGALEAEGSVALDDLAFATGSARLENGRFASLDALAEFLAANPQSVITLVGHTDASGDLAGNVALSKARATSVRDRLIADHGVAPARLRSEGVGYLAPRASNLTPEGRRLNRRVEAILVVPR